MGNLRNTAMDFLKKAGDACAGAVASAGKAAGDAATKADLSARLALAEREIKSLKEEWGLKTFDAHVSGDTATAQALTEEYKTKIEAVREKQMQLARELEEHNERCK